MPPNVPANETRSDLDRLAVIEGRLWALDIVAPVVTALLFVASVLLSARPG